MILITEKVAKLLLIAAALAGGWWVLGEKQNKNKKACLIYAALVLVFATMAYKISGLTPALTDTVTLTALDEKRGEAQAAEVFLGGYTIDGKTYAAGKSLQIEAGHWFWAGETYCWRSETDPRQPDGVTRSITVKLPVGWDRTLDFNGDVWRGFVEITAGGRTWTADTYAKSNTPVQVQIGRSQTAVLILQSVLRIAVFAIVLLVPFAAIYLFIKIRKNSGNEFVTWTASHYAELICGAIAIASVFVLFRYSEVDSLWYDELYQVALSLDNDCAIGRLLTHSDYYPSFSSDVLSLAYRIAPYGERWLLLVPEIFSVLGIYLVAMAAKRVHGRAAAIFTMLFGTTNTTLILRCAYEFRVYWLLFFSCCLTLYIYVRYRNDLDTAVTWKRLIIYGAALWLPAASHVFGVFFSAGLAITDMVYMASKRLSPRWIISFCITGVLYSPWLYNIICCDVWSMQKPWNGTPTPDGIVTLLRNWSSHGNFGYYFLLIGGGIVLVEIVLLVYSGKKMHTADMALFITLTFVVSFVYIYGKYVNPASTMWVERYFVVLVPCILWLQTLAAVSLCQPFKKHNVTTAAVCLMCACIGITNILQWFPTATVVGAKYRKSADWFYTQTNTIYNDSTIIISTFLHEYPETGWQEYYLTREGRRDALNLINQGDVDAAVLADKSVVYIYYGTNDIAERVLNLLEENGFAESANDEKLSIRTYIRSEQE